MVSVVDNLHHLNPPSPSVLLTLPSRLAWILAALLAAAPDGGFSVEKSIDMIAGGGAGSPSSSDKGLRDIFRAVACFPLC